MSNKQKRVYSEEENVQFLRHIIDRYIKCHGKQRICDQTTGEVSDVLFCQEYFLRYKTGLGLTDSTRDAKRMIDLMYKHVSRFYSQCIEKELAAGKDIDRTIRHYSNLSQEYLQPYKHRNLTGQWFARYTKKFVEFQKLKMPIAYHQKQERQQANTNEIQNNYIEVIDRWLEQFYSG